MRKFFLIACCAAALAACGQTAETPATTETPVAAGPQTAAEATAQDACGASQYQAMIGANIAAATFPAGSNVRVIMPGAAVTEDFRPERLNVITDANGAITSLQCY